MDDNQTKQAALSSIASLTWWRCYDASWRGLITDESWSHPAKFSHGLIVRIVDWLRSEGILTPGDVVADPFGGIGTGGIVCASRGLQWLGVELEPRFVEMANANFELHRLAWAACGDPQPAIVQGDSRKLRANLAGVLAAAAMPPGSVDAVLSSPPFSPPGCHPTGQGQGVRSDYREGKRTAAEPDTTYGDSSGQLAAMPMGSVDAVLSSPPYAECLRGDNSAKETAAESQAKRQTPGGSLGQSCRHAGYGSAENLGNLPSGSVDAVVSSPPYTPHVALNPGEKSRPEAKIERLTREGKFREAEIVRQHGSGAASNLRQQDYGQSPGQLGNLPPGDVAAVVSSPPWENQEPSHAQGSKFTIPHDTTGLSTACEYGNSEGQIGNTTGETFWAAALEIVRECYAILRPGGTAAWVVKSFVRNKQIVDFPGDWRKLCESVGFVTTHEIRAMLVKQKRDRDIFGGEDHVKETARISFFRRLAEKKGSPRILWETVWVMRKPSDAETEGHD